MVDSCSVTTRPRASALARQRASMSGDASSPSTSRPRARRSSSGSPSPQPSSSAGSPRAAHEPDVGRRIGRTGRPQRRVEVGHQPRVEERRIQLDPCDEHGRRRLRGGARPPATACARPHQLVDLHGHPRRTGAQLEVGDGAGDRLGDDLGRRRRVDARPRRRPAPPPRRWRAARGRAAGTPAGRPWASPASTVPRPAWVTTAEAHGSIAVWRT